MYKDDDQFQVGTLLWVQLNGFPWWPARVILPEDIIFGSKRVPVKKDEVLVLFFNNNNRYCTIKRNMTVPLRRDAFCEARLKYRGRFCKRLTGAIKEAFAYTAVTITSPKGPVMNSAPPSNKPPARTGAKTVLHPDIVPFDARIQVKAEEYLNATFEHPRVGVDRHSRQEQGQQTQRNGEAAPHTRQTQDGDRHQSRHRGNGGAHSLTRDDTPTGRRMMKRGRRSVSLDHPRAGVDVPLQQEQQQQRQPNSEAAPHTRYIQCQHHQLRCHGFRCRGKGSADNTPRAHPTMGLRGDNLDVQWRSNDSLSDAAIAASKGGKESQYPIGLQVDRNARDLDVCSVPSATANAVTDADPGSQVGLKASVKPKASSTQCSSRLDRKDANAQILSDKQSYYVGNSGDGDGESSHQCHVKRRRTSDAPYKKSLGKIDKTGGLHVLKEEPETVNVGMDGVVSQSDKDAKTHEPNITPARYPNTDVDDDSDHGNDCTHADHSGSKQSPNSISNDVNNSHVANERRGVIHLPWYANGDGNGELSRERCSKRRRTTDVCHRKSLGKIDKTGGLHVLKEEPVTVNVGMDGVVSQSDKDAKTHEPNITPARYPNTDVDDDSDHGNDCTHLDHSGSNLSPNSNSNDVNYSRIANERRGVIQLPWYTNAAKGGTSDVNSPSNDSDAGADKPPGELRKKKYDTITKDGMKDATRRQCTDCDNAMLDKTDQRVENRASHSVQGNWKCMEHDGDISAQSVDGVATRALTTVLSPATTHIAARSKPIASMSTAARRRITTGAPCLKTLNSIIQSAF